MGILAEPLLWGGWALDRHTAEELAAHLHRAQPRLIVECGSGSSTLLLAEYASRTGATVISLEHSEHHAANTYQGLAAYNLLDFVDVQVRPLMTTHTPGGVFPWYAGALPVGIDFALIDGPPGTVGRQGALYALHPHMSEDRPWEIWLDDADREGEQECLRLWRGYVIFREEHIPTPKGLARITPGHLLSPRFPVDASDVAVTLLTGGRPDLLTNTITSLLVLAPGLLETAHVAVLHNGADPETAAILSGEPWVDHLTVLEDRLTVGQASTALLATPAPRPYTLHLEDDWVVATAETGWLDMARKVLDSNPHIGQVRLRHRGDRVLKHHLLTRRPLWWEDGPEGTQVAPAHYTLNPSLMRSVDTPQVWPAAGEKEAARNFYNQSWQVAQAVPGVFRHIGEGASLRLGQRR